MNITSYSFYFLIAITLIIYYIIPLNYRWMVLLFSTLVFIFRANSVLNGCIAIIMAVWTYILAIVIGKRTRYAKISMICAIIGIVFLLFLFKEQVFFINVGNQILSITKAEVELKGINLIAPLGISYFALSLISYICEVYWGTIEAEKNVLKFITFGLFFPTLTSGPIVKYKNSAEKILGGNRFEYNRFCAGLQRIAWGFFKKLVISERLAILVNTIYGDYETYNGLYIFLASCAFTLQLYTDFSGCIDIILGVSELFGIKLPENFDVPFASLTLAEFWRRWHITLGIWLKEYILYPILKSNIFQNLTSKTKKRFGKKIGKKIPTWIALLISWLMVGFWHGGGYNYIIGVGLYMGVIIVLSEMLTTPFNWMKKRLHINDTCFSWRFFQMARTYLLFSFGLSFFRASNLAEGVKIWKSCFFVFNPWIFFDGSLYMLGLDAKDIKVLIIGLSILIIMGIVRFKTQTEIRELIANQNIAFRWILYMILLMSIIIFGMYGAGYDANAFIYQGF